MSPLTPVELETLQILARTGNTKSVAARRGVTQHTVCGVLKNVYRKLSVHSSTEAAYLLGRSEQPMNNYLELAIAALQRTSPDADITRMQRQIAWDGSNMRLMSDDRTIGEHLADAVREQQRVKDAIDHLRELMVGSTAS